MKIAVYHNSPGGGAKRALYYFVKELSQRHTIEEFTLTTANPFLPLKPYVKHSHVYDVRKIKLPRVKPYILDCVRALATFCLMNRRFDAVCARAAREINAAHFDVALVDMCLFAHAPHILKYLKVPNVYYCHDPFRALYEKEHFIDYNLNKKTLFRRTYAALCEKILFKEEKLRGKIDRENCLRAELVLTNSCYTREYIHKVYGRVVDVNYLGVDTDLFQKISEHKENYIVSVGRLFPEKRHDLIIRALALLSVNERPKLVIVGDKSEEDEKARLEELASKNAVHLEIREMVTDEELVKIYNHARMAVFVPFMEPFGFVPLEAMACGTAVIGVREGGVRESIIDEQTGLLVDASDDQLARAITRLQKDNALRQRLERNGLDHVKAKWTWSIATRNLEKRLERLSLGKERSI